MALGYDLYGSCAVNLAMSIKAFEPSISICLVHDDKAIAHLKPEEKALFDKLVTANTEDYTVNGQKQYQMMKLAVNKYSPFENSLYIDVDTLWFPKKKISDLISHLIDFDFFIGKNGEYNPISKKKTGVNYTYWGDPFKIVNYFKLRNPLPQTISGVFWFKKSAFSNEVFTRALEIYRDQKAPCIKWANGKADEYCFNVALSQMNYQQQNSHLVYFDKTNGVMQREQMFLHFWGMAAGGNRLNAKVADLYNDLVAMYHKAFNIGVQRLHVDKAVLIKERRNF